MMGNLWNSKFWYLTWLVPALAITTILISQIIGKIQSREYFRIGDQYRKTDEFKQSERFKKEAEARHNRKIGIYEDSVADAETQCVAALEALAAAEAATNATAAANAALAAKAAAERATDASLAAAVTVKSFPGKIAKQLVKQATLASGSGRKGQGVKLKIEGGVVTELDPRAIPTLATPFAERAQAAAAGAQEIAERWRRAPGKG